MKPKVALPKPSSINDYHKNNKVKVKYILLICVHLAKYYKPVTREKSFGLIEGYLMSIEESHN